MHSLFSGLLARVLPCVVVLSVLGACSTMPGQEAVPGSTAAARAGGNAQLPPLLPTRRFVANIDAEGGYQLSPDGQKLLWVKTVGLDVGLAVRGVTNPSVVSTFATGNMGRRGGSQTWLADSQHVVYTKDTIGDENTTLMVLDTQASGFKPWPATPIAGVRSFLVGRGAQSSSRFYFGSKDRKSVV